MATSADTFRRKKRLIVGIEKFQTGQLDAAPFLRPRGDVHRRFVDIRLPQSIEVVSLYAIARPPGRHPLILERLHFFSGEDAPAVQSDLSEHRSLNQVVGIALALG
jgi:hypothetical protein